MNRVIHSHTARMLMLAGVLTLLVVFGAIDPATAGVAMLVGNTADTGTGGDAGSQGGAEGGQASAAGDGGAATNSTGQQSGAQAAAGATNPQTTGQQPQEVVYEFKLPDGMELDTAARDAFIPLAKELKLSPEQAQKFVDLKVADVQRQAEAWQSQQAQWVDQVKADAEVGGDNLEKSLAYAKAAVDFIGDPELTKLLNTTGYGNHPTLVKAFVKIGKQLAPDSFVGGKREPAANTEDARLARMYPTMAKG